MLGEEVQGGDVTGPEDQSGIDRGGGDTLGRDNRRPRTGGKREETAGNPWVLLAYWLGVGSGGMAKDKDSGSRFLKRP